MENYARHGAVSVKGLGQTNPFFSQLRFLSPRDDARRRNPNAVPKTSQTMSDHPLKEMLRQYTPMSVDSANKQDLSLRLLMMCIFYHHMFRAF